MNATHTPRAPRTASLPNRQAAAHRLALLQSMLRVRRFEERCVELYSAARIRGFMHLYIGEEAVAVGVNEALTEDDAVVSTYREHGHALARGVPAEAIMAEMFGKVTGCSRGRRIRPGL
ncbi:thiamine pyrophosphate-dependent enzyme [Streptomyces sp. NPDC086787]|uniref:thiamine pyrophosphate-dependent enzyme n=1 Tax=Streptomyces sp. NPDC086787 TaxID=3365759 RepID=UPI00380BB90C